MIFFVPLRTVAFWVFLAAVVLLSLAAGAAGPRRTAAWYAAHPRQMHAMRRACANDPGHGHASPDCMNMAAGEAREALAIGRRQTGLFVPPSSPAFWRGNPDLPRQAYVCDHLAPADQINAFCGAVRDALR